MIRLEITLDDNIQHQQDVKKALQELDDARKRGEYFCRTIYAESANVIFC